MHAVSIGGVAGSGKDCIANALAGELNKRYKIPAIWQRSAFARAVKQVFMDTFNVSFEFIEEWKRKEEPPPGFTMNIRKSLQMIGDGFRRIDPDVWIKKVFSTSQPIIISDLRYPANEAKAVHQRKGVNVLVWRPYLDESDNNDSEALIRPIANWFASAGWEGPIDLSSVNNYPKDAQWFDYFIRNDRSLDDLNNKVTGKLVPFIEEFFQNVTRR